ncbi:extensin-like [Beta vulgaris subsp. vulgaris]|uniref:extensin-like n=1 Tax=Beta vulgaris subsp. vulgaris TaxID=3555 RepID=UPI002036BD5E|nr:extensin-like [Beta vulgaris subsp. vulgaris]
MTRVRSKKEKLGDSPPDVYKHIKKEDWATFKEKMTSDVAVRENALEITKKNTHHQHLGQRSYGDARELWKQENLSPPSFDSRSSSSTPSSSVSLTFNRGDDWWCAMQKKDLVTKERFIPVEETKIAADKYLEYKEKQAKGEFIPVRNRDPLFLVLEEKPDHSGHCYGFGGVNVGHTKAFGHPTQPPTGPYPSFPSPYAVPFPSHVQSPTQPPTGPYPSFPSPYVVPSLSHVQPPTQPPTQPPVRLYHFFLSPFALASPTQPTQPPIPSFVPPSVGPSAGPSAGPYVGPSLGQFAVPSPTQPTQPPIPSFVPSSASPSTGSCHGLVASQPTQLRSPLSGFFDTHSP